MNYIKASAQVVEIENQDVVTDHTSAEKAAALAAIFGQLDMDDTPKNRADLNDKLLSYPGLNKWNLGLDGLVEAYLDERIKLNQINMSNLGDKHKVICLHDGSTNSSAYSYEEEDFEDAEW